MISKDVLFALQESGDQYVSGAELAKKLGVTRSAVWKAIAALRDEGVPIEATTNRGYRLAGDVLSEEGIRKYLKSDVFDFKMYRSTSSTNDVARSLAADGAREGTVVVAWTQQAGRGRQGRPFFSPYGCGVYFSLVLRPKRFERFLTVMAAVAVADGIENAGGKRTSVKWVNDVFVDGKKCCGILTEAVTNLESGGIEYAVVGIGINVKTPPEGYGELEGIVTAALDGVTDALNKTVAAVLDRFWQLYTADDVEEVKRMYRSRSFLIGKPLVVVRGESERDAVAIDIDDECRLIVKYDDGSVERLGAGEVKIKW